MAAITKLRMDYLENPIGVARIPQFGWVIGSDERDVRQAEYHLQISSQSAFGELIYDSSWVKSEESAHIIVEGPLESGRKYYVRVRIRTTGGEETAWGETGYFITGILDSKEWLGEFISAETQQDNTKSNGTRVEGSFRVRKQVAEAYAFTTALGLYQLDVNGTRVGCDEMAPGWTSYHNRLLYQTYDIKPYLTDGQNSFGANLGAGWYKGKMGFVGDINNYGKQTAFLGQILIRYEDGSSQIIVTDRECRGGDTPICFSEIYDGEVYDARLEKEECRHWRPVETVAFDKAKLVPQAGCRVKMMDCIPAEQIFTTPAGDKVIDFGQNMAGWIHFKVKGYEGARVELNCFEVLDAQGNVYLDNLRGAQQTITYICKDDREAEYHPHFTFQGFRYARIAEYPGEPELTDFTAYAVHSDMEPTGTFRCSNQLVNQLQHNILWGLKSNFLDIPTDCPQRNERLGWTGDAQIFCRTASFLMNTYTFFSKWLKDLAADQTPEGGVPHVIPDIVSGREWHDWLMSQGTHSAAAWADAAVINPWTLYLTYGDKVILEEQYDSMKAWIEFMHRHAQDGIWNYKLQFGDWVALDAEEGSYFGATPNGLTCTAYYAYSTELFAKTAKVLQREEDYRTYRQLYEEIKAGYQRYFFTEDGHLTAQTQTAHIVSLYFKLVPEQYIGQIAADLVKLLERENNHLVTGFVGTPYFCHALSENGYTREAYDLLLKEDFPSWLYQVKMGATTVWEHWDGIKPDGTMWSPGMNSFNHYAYGAIGEWLYRVVAGIEIDEAAAGYQHSIIYPRIGGGLSFAEAAYESVYGTLKTGWQAETTAGKTRVRLQVRIPHNTTATIILDRAAAVLADDGIGFEPDGGNRKGTCGSGEYEILFETL